MVGVSGQDLRDEALALRSEEHAREPPVARVGAAFDEAVALGAVDEAREVAGGDEHAAAELRERLTVVALEVREQVEARHRRRVGRRRRISASIRLWLSRRRTHTLTSSGASPPARVGAPRRAGFAAVIARVGQHGDALDLDERARLEESRDLHEAHRRVVLAHALAPPFADGAASRRGRRRGR